MMISPSTPHRSSWISLVAKSIMLLGLTVPTVAVATSTVGRTMTNLPSTALAQATGRPILRTGSTGNAVTEVQALLTLLGYFKDSVDGNYQNTTEAAVEAFQRDIGLRSDGIVGPATWEKLLPTPSTEFNPPDVPAVADADDVTTDDEDDGDELVALPTLRQGMNGPAVVRIQETLKARGFYTGSIDGIFGPGTEAAVMAFQESERLAADGVVGPATWQALLN